MKHSFLLFFAFILLLAGCTHPDRDGLLASNDEIGEYLHVPSPEWQDQVIYFLMTDRFMDGDTTINDQGAGEYKKGDERYWNGGDLEGIMQKLDYIRELGVTAIWITPPVANQWVNPDRTGTGNHGYWATDFMKVDQHYGTLDDYRRLSASLHKNGMYLIQDIVVNHLGDFYTYTGPYNPDDVTENFMVHDVPQPTQYPFYHNDARDPEDTEMDIFHFTPVLTDHSDTVTKVLYQFGDLDDLNTANPLVRKVLRESFNFWIDSVGVDGYRFDTPIFVEFDFWKDFLHSEDPEVPGIIPFAASKGKERFFDFGETLIPTRPYEEKAVKKIARYVGTPEDPVMTSVINFPLKDAIDRVFQQQMPTDVLTYRLQSVEANFPAPQYLVNFIDNHDGARYLTHGSHASFRQALLFILTIPGVPTIYYGTEQELTGMRQTMFKGGVGSPDHDHFNTESAPFLFLKELIRMRKDNRVFSRGALAVLQDNPAGPGVFAYRMSRGDTTVIVAMNTSESIVLADEFQVPFEPGTIMQTMYSLSGEKSEPVVSSSGGLSMMLPPGEGIVLVPSGEEAETRSAAGKITIDPLPGGPVTGKYLELNGSYSGGGRISVMVDGNFNGRGDVFMKSNQRWSHSLPLKNLSDGKHRVSLLLQPGEDPDQIISDHIVVNLQRPSEPVARFTDPAGDDHGPEGTYSYPTAPGYNHQMDIRSVEAFARGHNIDLVIIMADITRKWIPPNGFDHLLINIFIDVPGQEGIRELPKLNAEMPGDAAWDYMISAAGFGNAMFSADGAAADRLGAVTGPAAMISSDTVSNTITFSIKATALGYPEQIDGTKLYITTWGGSPGNPRHFSERPEPWLFFGGDEDDPMIMDDTELITIGKL